MDTDTDTDEYKKHVVQRDGEKDIRFTGYLVAEAKSNRDTGRWTILRLYQTKGGKFICERIGYTRWDGEHDKHSGAVCATEAEVIEFFGHGWLSKQIYAEADIDAAEVVE